MLESRHTCMTRFRQLALLVYPTLAESAADCPVPSLIPMEFAPNVLAQRKNDIGPSRFLQNSNTKLSSPALFLVENEGEKKANEITAFSPFASGES